MAKKIKEKKDIKVSDKKGKSKEASKPKDAEMISPYIPTDEHIVNNIAKDVTDSTMPPKQEFTNSTMPSADNISEDSVKLYPSEIIEIKNDNVSFIEGEIVLQSVVSVQRIKPCTFVFTGQEVKEGEEYPSDFVKGYDCEIFEVAEKFWSELQDYKNNVFTTTTNNPTTSTDSETPLHHTIRTFEESLKTIPLLNIRQMFHHEFMPKVIEHFEPHYKAGMHSDSIGCFLKVVDSEGNEARCPRDANSYLPIQ